jgi:ABC-type multidrug transport system ATPase subunit
MHVEDVAELVELIPLRGALVGLPGVNGLSTEQRKRLTIAVELVANPSIIFMDEPTSGLDATAAAIVMRTVRNTVDTGRTVVCTIHQPSIDIFEAFDEVSSINDEKIVEVILEPVLSLRLQAVLELL